MFIRLSAALIVGCVIGVDREIKRRGAGIKTHIIVCLGSALVMMTSQYMYIEFGGVADLGRLGAQVISGVGFLGVGTIIVTGRHRIKGLTTAAGLWTCACVGLAAGIGFIEGVVLCLFFVVFRKVDALIQKNSKVFDLYLEFESNRGVISFKECLHIHNFRLTLFELTQSPIKEEGPSAIATVEVVDKKKRLLLIDILKEVEGVKFVEEL